ncbi:type VI secretion system lipoprotein TssJ [Xylophilus sp. Kf1]|nr:type VI secretion system lipoprotein TssJ [Xylophilus sp. Kf1]
MKIPRREWILRAGAVSLLPNALPGCSVLGGGDEPKPKESLRMEIAIAAAPDANIDRHERGAPILLRIYELAVGVGFQEADFFSLQDRDKITLGSDLLAVDSFMLRPGETRAIRRKAQAGTTAIGVFAAYRDLPAAVWRISHALPPPVDAHWYRKAPRLRLEVLVQARGLDVKDVDALPDTALASRSRESAASLAKDLPTLPEVKP